MLRLIVLGLLAVGTVVAFPTRAVKIENQANIFDNVTVIGKYGKTAWSERYFTEFLGIKYAEAPSGDLRFKPPVPYAHQSPVYDATEYGRQCPILANAINSPPIVGEDIEDCLHLSVFTDTTKSNQPVMVYIHGGGFVDGGAAHHPPYYLMEEDIVLVVIQYRLGPFGFYATLTDDAPGNVGILDCFLALDWVQKFISAFGGDPDNVTVFGQSAGAAIVNTLTFSPLVSIQSFVVYELWH